MYDESITGKVLIPPGTLTPPVHPDRLSALRAVGGINGTDNP